MYKINFEKPTHIHFIGIGGISMSGLAEILLEEGFTVSGSDSKESPLTKKLESEGAIIHYGQCAFFLVSQFEYSFLCNPTHLDFPGINLHPLFFCTHLWIILYVTYFLIKL